MAFGRVRPVSVAVLHVRQWVVQDIVDSTGSSVRDYDLNAGGAAEFYANGTVIRGSWASGGESAPLVFNDAGGHQLLMPSGLLFVSVAP
jgi:hypothetical protein